MLNKVLCVDDDSISVMLCRKVISRSFFAAQTDAASNGKTALQYLQDVEHAEEVFYPELILLDLNMPVMNGWEFLENYEQHYAHKCIKTKVVVLSSTIDPEDVKKAKQFATVVDFISKPITVESLAEVANKLKTFK